MEDGIFDPCHIAFIDQRECAHQHRLLDAAYDYDLVGMKIGTAEVAQVSSYCLPQFDLATARGITQQVRSLFRQNLLTQALPNSNREFIDGWQPGDERDRWRAANADVELWAAAKIGHSRDSSGDTRGMLGARRRRQPCSFQKS